MGIYNPTSGGGGGGFIVNGDTVTETSYATLTSNYPPADNTDILAWVLTTTGVPFINYHPSGWYISNGSSWVEADPPEEPATLVEVDTSGFHYSAGNDAQEVFDDLDTAIFNTTVSAVGLNITGGGSVPATGAQMPVTVPYSGVITNWYLAADQTGSCVIDVKRSGTSIVGGGGNKPTLSSAQTGNAAVSGWTSTAISAGDVIQFNLDSISTITFVNLVLRVTRT